MTKYSANVYKIIIAADCNRPITGKVKALHKAHYVNNIKDADSYTKPEKMVEPITFQVKATNKVSLGQLLFQRHCLRKQFGTFFVCYL